MSMLSTGNANATRWEYEVSGYYGPGGRTGGRGRPGECEGDLAKSVGCNGIGTMQTEVLVFKGREDIGKIVVSGANAGRILRRNPDGGWPEHAETGREGL